MSERNAHAVLNARIHGACHGFRVRSDMPLDLTRFADAAAPMPVLDLHQAAVPEPEPAQQPIYTWVPQPGRPLSGRLHRLPDGYGMWVDGLGVYRVEPSLPRITVPANVPPLLWEPRVWGVPAAICFITLGDMSFHAAAIDVGGMALLLVGPGRFGKSTLAAAFLRAGHRILSEDICRCTLEPFPAVYPGPAVLRMRRDSWEHLESLPGTRVVMEEDDRIHLVIDPQLRGGSDPVPLRGIVTLEVRSEDTILEQLDPTTAISLLWATSFSFPEPADRTRCFLGVSGLVDRVPVWRLSRSLEYDTLAGLLDRIVTTCLG